jgi:drug/metabolite transporter (DMT)-like permease
VQKAGLFDYGFSGIAVGLLLAIFSTILGHSIFSWCLKFFAPSFVSAAKLMEPVVASILAVFLFREIPTALQLLGGGLILAGVYTYAKMET